MSCGAAFTQEDPPEAAWDPLKAYPAYPEIHERRLIDTVRQISRRAATRIPLDVLAWAAQGEQARVPTDAVTLPAGRYTLEQVLQRLKAVLPPLQWQEGPPRPIRIDDNPALTPWGITGPIVHQGPSLGPVTRKVARGKTIRDVLNQVADRTGRVWCALALNGNLETPLAFRLADGTPVRGTQFWVDASLNLRP